MKPAENLELLEKKICSYIEKFNEQEIKLIFELFYSYLNFLQLSCEKEFQNRILNKKIRS